MAIAASVKDAHDKLLGDFPEMPHEPCVICLATEKAEEVAVSDDRTYTSVEHAALLEDAVARETASLRAEKEDLESVTGGLQAEKAELLNKIDVLEAEKAAAEAARDAAVQEFVDFKAEQERAAEVEALKAERAEQVKAALDGIDEAYFTEARVARWAEMSAEQFETVLADLQETAGAMKKKKDAPADDNDGDEGSEEKARESAAFKGGTEPTSVKPESGTTLGQLFGRTRTKA